MLELSIGSASFEGVLSLVWFGETSKLLVRAKAVEEGVGDRFRGVLVAVLVLEARGDLDKLTLLVGVLLGVTRGN